MACSTFSSRWKRIGSGIALAEFVAEFGWYLTLEPLYKRLSVFNILLYLVAMIVVVGKRRVHFSERQLWVVSNNLFNGIAEAFMPDRDILHTDTMPSNTWFAATGARRGNDVLSADKTV